MGKNRPIIARQVPHQQELPRGIFELFWYLLKYAILSAGLSYVAFLIWNYAVKDVFGLPEITFFGVWGIFVLLSITVVALRGLEHIGLSANPDI